MRLEKRVELMTKPSSTDSGPDKVVEEIRSKLKANSYWEGLEKV
jgi:hypothetical protein